MTRGTRIELNGKPFEVYNFGAEADKVDRYFAAAKSLTRLTKPVVFRYRTTCDPFTEPDGPPARRVTAIAHLFPEQFDQNGKPDRIMKKLTRDMLSNWLSLGDYKKAHRQIYTNILIRDVGVFECDVPVETLIDPWRDIAAIEVVGTVEYEIFWILPPGFMAWGLLFVPMRVRFQVEVLSVCDEKKAERMMATHGSAYVDLVNDNPQARALTREALLFDFIDWLRATEAQDDIAKALKEMANRLEKEAEFLLDQGG